MKTRTLKKLRRRKALYISGDFWVPLLPILRKVLFLWYKGNKDCMIPVTQKKVNIPAMNINISHCPISARVRWFLVSAILMKRKIMGFISWKSCSPEILSINFILLSTEDKIRLYS